MEPITQQNKVTSHLLYTKNFCVAYNHLGKSIELRSNKELPADKAVVMLAKLQAQADGASKNESALFFENY